MDYKYWNDFVDKWRNIPFAYSYLNKDDSNNHILGWENPNSYGLLNSVEPNDFSSFYLPEPWWGNDGNLPLNSVVINYNPGWAEPYKTISLPEIKNLHQYPDYASFVNSQVTKDNNAFPRTNNWHWKERAKPVFDTCERIGYNLNGNNKLGNHLSVELIPWHTTDIRNILKYIYCNINQVYSKSLVFAADQSRRIQNEILRNKVIIRSGGKTTLNLLEKIKESGIAQFQIVIQPTFTPCSSGTTTGKGGYFKFTISTLPDIEFICIWGKTSRNKFPPKGDMDWIFSNVI